MYSLFATIVRARACAHARTCRAHAHARTCTSFAHVCVCARASLARSLGLTLPLSSPPILSLSLLPPPSPSFLPLPLSPPLFPSLLPSSPPFLPPSFLPYPGTYRPLSH